MLERRTCERAGGVSDVRQMMRVSSMDLALSDLDQANTILSGSIGMDAHVDTVQRLLIEGANLDDDLVAGHVDYPRLRAGGVDALFCALWTPTYYPPSAAWSRTLDLIAAARMFCSHSAHFTIATNAVEGLNAIRRSCIGMFLTLEGCDCLDGNLCMFDELQAAGVSSIGLTHVTANWLADSSTANPVHRGLSQKGREAIQKMNSLGLLIDISHSSDEAVKDVLGISAHPIIASHSCCRALCDSSRNLPDYLIEGIAAKGGLVCIAAHSAFLHPNARHEGSTSALPGEKAICREALDDHLAAEHTRALRTPASVYATVHHVVDHIDHAVQVAGISGVAIGSDFDGGITPPQGFENISQRPNLAAQLLHRGYSSRDIQRLFGENLLEVLRRVQRAC